MWFAGAIVAVAAGAVAAVIYAVTWYGYTKGDCGVVRVYEHAFGLIVVGTWLAGTIIGVSVAIRGRRRNSAAVVSGSIAAAAVSLGMVLMCTQTLSHISDMNFPAKTTGQLLEIMNRSDAPHRDQAIIELGQRKIAEAAPVLCALLDDEHSAAYLRHSAAVALGAICEPPRPPGVDLERALSSLVRALNGGVVAPREVAYALGRVGDARALPPLAVVLCDPSQPAEMRECVARAMGMIGGGEARAALEKARTSCQGEGLDAAIEGALKDMESKSRAGDRAN